MRRTDLLNALGAFALVAVVVLGGTVAVGTLLSGPDDTSSPDASAFTSDSLPASPIADDGTITAPGGEPKTVVVDRSHANAVEKAGIQPLVDALVSQGHTVRFYSGSTDSQSFGGLSDQSGESAFNETLGTADSFVVANPGTDTGADPGNQDIAQGNCEIDQEPENQKRERASHKREDLAEFEVHHGIAPCCRARGWLADRRTRPPPFLAC